jgi:formate dehydrogenase subunit delta
MKHNNVDHMVKMVNEISAFWAAEAPDPKSAAASVATHLRRFWDPRMRRQIVEHYHAGAGGLTDIAREAIGILAAPAPPPPPEASQPSG